MCSRLIIISFFFTYTKDGDGSGSSVVEAKEKDDSAGHGGILIVDSHTEIGEELNDHASNGEIRNWQLQLSSQPGIDNGLVETANITLNDDKSAKDDERE